VALSKPPPTVVSRRRSPAAGRSSARGRPGAAALALLAALASGTPARAETIMRQVFAVEARYGNDPNELIAHLGALETPARASGGDDLRAFLAAWGYAHAATDKPAVADAAVEELTDIGERTHDPAALASAYTLKASQLAFSGQERAAFGWIEEALPYARRNPSPDLHYWVEMTAADLAMNNGQLDEGLRLFEDAARSAREVRNPRREAQAYQSLVPMRIVKGQTALALRDAALVRELGARSTDRGLVVVGWVWESLAARADGQVERADRVRAQAMKTHDEIGARLEAESPGAAAAAETVNSQAGQVAWLSSEQDALMTLSTDYLSVRNYAKAAEAAARARAQSESRHDGDTAAHALIALGMADIGLGKVAQGKDEAGSGLRALERVKRDPELLIQLNRYIAMLERSGEANETLARLRQSLVLENELARHDRKNTVVALQRQSSFEQHQREVEQLEHENALQSVELSRRSNERALMLMLAAVLAIGVAAAWWLYLRARRSNRELAVTNEKLAHASLHDKVTGLLNRRAMEVDTRAIELAGSASYCNVSISVKQFGLIVGSVGHQLGDALLCQIATRLDDVARRFEGRLYRVDGVTFGALFRFGHDRQRLQAILEALTATMDAPFEIGNQDLIVSIGVGASEYPKDAGATEEVARLAELAKLQAHGDPGNSYLVYDSRIGETQRDKLRMESRMLKALEHGDFELFYQGQRGLPDGRICGFEALLRWRDGDKMIPPAEFIPLAEETGLIVRMGTWVLEQACRQARIWADSGAGRPLVAVNISPRQFNHPDFLATVRDTLARTGVDPRQIELEITEGSVMNDAENSIVQLHALRELGLHLAIDDFGTGYASLSYLRRFPLDRLKIDRSFIMQLNASEQDDTIVRTVIELAHTLGLSVTAEGVETIEQESVLQGWGCDVIQGFLRFRPASAAMATGFLEKDKQDALVAA
jgi:EAL domain-containing protein (putative c-di-GMP-specific phosphodiesterase class I)/GGDEF domain-containing protein